MTVADLKQLSLGFVIDFCIVKTQLRNKKYKSDEEKYSQLKDIVPFVLEDYENGKIDDLKYNDFLATYKSLEDEYGWDYD